MSTLTQIKKLYCNHEYFEAINEVDNIHDEDKSMAETIKGRILAELGAVNEAKVLVNQLLSKFDFEDSIGKIVILGNLVTEAYLAWKEGKYDDVIIKVESIEGLLDNVDDELRQDSIIRWSEGHLLNLKGIYYWDLGDLEKASIPWHQSYLLRLMSGNQNDTAASLNNLGNLFYQKGEYYKALNFYKKSLELRVDCNPNQNTTAAWSNIGSVYYELGDLEKAKEYYEKSLDQIDTQKNPTDAAYRWNSLGLIYQSQGHLDQALEYHLKSLVIYQRDKNSLMLAWTLRNLGRLYYEKNLLRVAIDHLENSLFILSQFGNKLEIASTLYYLLKSLVKSGQSEKVAIYHRQLKGLRDELNNDVVTTKCLIICGMVNQRRLNFRSFVKAQDQFKEVIDRDQINSLLKLDAKLAYSEFLLIEFNTIKGDIIAKEITDLANEIYKFGQDNIAMPYIINGLVLKAKLKLLIGDAKQTTNGFNLLEIAEIYGLEHGLDKLLAEINEDKNKLIEKLRIDKRTAEVIDFIRVKKFEEDLDDYLETLANFEFD